MAKSTTTTPVSSPPATQADLSKTLDAISNLSATPTVQTPIGVPKGFVAKLPSQYSQNDADSVGTPMPQQPNAQYKEGDEYSPATEPPASIADLQKQMAAVGLLKKGTAFQLGVWDAASADAYKGLLGYANQQGVNSLLAMSKLQQTGGFASVDDNGNIVGAGSAAQKVTLTSPDQIKALVQSVAPSVLGKEAPQSVIDTITNTLHGLQQQAATTGTTTADDVTAAPTANSAWFQEQLKELMPNTYNANRMFQGLAAVQNQIGQNNYSNLVSK